MKKVAELSKPGLSDLREHSAIHPLINKYHNQDVTESTTAKHCKNSDPLQKQTAILDVYKETEMPE